MKDASEKRVDHSELQGLKQKPFMTMSTFLRGVFSLLSIPSFILSIEQPDYETSMVNLRN